MNTDEINLNGGLARPGKTTEVGMKLGAKKFPNKTKGRGSVLTSLDSGLAPPLHIRFPALFVKSMNSLISKT